MSDLVAAAAAAATADVLILYIVAQHTHAYVVR